MVLRESGDTSLTCGFPLPDGGYEEGRPIGMGAWLQLEELQEYLEKYIYHLLTNIRVATHQKLKSSLTFL